MPMYKMYHVDVEIRWVTKNPLSATALPHKVVES